FTSAPRLPLTREELPLAAACILPTHLLYCTPSALSCTTFAELPTWKPSNATRKSDALAFFVPVTLITMLCAAAASPLKRNCGFHSALGLYRSNVPLFTPSIVTSALPISGPLRVIHLMEVALNL